MNEHIIAEADGGIRLDRWFKRHMPELPHAMLEKALRKGQVRLDGKKAKSSDRIEANQVLRIDPALEEVSPAPAHRPSRVVEVPESDIKKLRDCILYQDDAMLVLNKPAGLAVQGGSGQRLHVDALLPHLLPEEPQELKLVHRLDKDTSGVLVIAKGASAAGKLAKLFADKDMEKIYLALVAGQPKPREGRIDKPLFKDARGKFSGMAAYEMVWVDEEQGQRALTEYRVLDAIGKQLAWVELRPITGRTHQLRVHMAEIGCPIIGDGKYGGPEAFMKELGLPEKLHLHAERIILPQWKGKRLEVKAPLPPHMKESKRLLGE